MTWVYKEGVDTDSKVTAQASDGWKKPQNTALECETKQTDSA